MSFPVWSLPFGLSPLSWTLVGVCKSLTNREEEDGWVLQGSSAVPTLWHLQGTPWGAVGLEQAWWACCLRKTQGTHCLPKGHVCVRHMHTKNYCTYIYMHILWNSKWRMRRKGTFTQSSELERVQEGGMPSASHLDCQTLNVGIFQRGTTSPHSQPHSHFCSILVSFSLSFLFVSSLPPSISSFLSCGSASTLFISSHLLSSQSHVCLHASAAVSEKVCLCVCVCGGLLGV